MKGEVENAEQTPKGWETMARTESASPGPRKVWGGPVKICKTCLAKIARNALACPHCGHFYPGCSRVEILAGVILIGLMIAAGWAVVRYCMFFGIR